VELAAKLQIKPGQQVSVVAAPPEVLIALPSECELAADPSASDVVIAFARSRAEMTTIAQPAIEAARLGKLAWVAYPKAGKLGTDLNRDALREALVSEGVRPVRQVAIDDVWSALRFRPS